MRSRNGAQSAPMRCGMSGKCCSHICAFRDRPLFFGSMEYKELAKIYHMDSTSKRDSADVRLAADRRNAESAFRLGYPSTGDEFFIAVPRELSMLNERVLRTERKLSAQFKSLLGIASNAILRGLVLDEVVSSNEIEGVRSTHRQFKDALEAEDNSAPRRRFRELATLYMDLMNGTAQMPKTPKDIRRIYNCAMGGEIGKKDILDGALFRAEGVDILGGRNKVSRRGLEPESRIVEALERMLAIASSEDIPSLYGAIAAHYLFEYAHPFYDGNGRTGRYLLALYLSVPLSAATSLSLSRTIAEHKRQYYKAFEIAENPLNHGELIHFVYMMLGLVNMAQEDILERLDETNTSYKRLSDVMGSIKEGLGLKKKESMALSCNGSWRLSSARW